MKKITISIILILALFMSLSVNALADNTLQATFESDNDSTVILYEDGSRLTITRSTGDATPCGYASSDSNTISKRIEAQFENSDGEVEWIYTLYATFSYVTGVSSVCTDAYYEQTIYQGNWTFSNGSATKSGNTARGIGNYIKKFLFITAKDIDIDLTMTCDKYGNVT